MTTTDDRLTDIDAKLTALLALYLDKYLRDTGIARPKDRSIDRILADAGLSTKTIAGLLGKTDRAVRLQLQRESKREARA
jgi:hypothetical protein